jgi:uncharacterized membrane-anchored protein YhcB (DUF1043 family)
LVEIDLTNVIIPLVVGIIVPFIIIFLSRFGKTQEGALTGTIRIEGLKTNIEETRETMDRGFNRIETLLNNRDTEMRTEFARAKERINDIGNEVQLNRYRIDRLERERGWQGGAKKEDNG